MQKCKREKGKSAKGKKAKVKKGKRQKGKNNFLPLEISEKFPGNEHWKESIYSVLLAIKQNQKRRVL